jgi:hypothetical protein
MAVGWVDVVEGLGVVVMSRENPDSGQFTAGGKVDEAMRGYCGAVVGFFGSPWAGARCNPGGNLGKRIVDWMMTSDRVPWERQPGESSKQYHAFVHYRDLSARAIGRAWVQHKMQCEHVPVPVRRSSSRWDAWASQWGWVERAARWDLEIDRVHREKSMQALLEARERHARLAQATLTVLTMPIRAALEAAKDPAILRRLTEHAKTGPGGTIQLLAVISRMAQVIPHMVTVERLALGMTTEIVEVEDKRDGAVSFADRITKDPEATSLAVALLDRLARQQTATPG